MQSYAAKRAKGWAVIITIISLRTHFQIDALSRLLKDLSCMRDGAPAKELFECVCERAPLILPQKTKLAFSMGSLAESVLVLLLFSNRSFMARDCNGGCALEANNYCWVTERESFVCKERHKILCMWRIQTLATTFRLAHTLISLMVKVSLKYAVEQ